MRVRLTTWVVAVLAVYLVGVTLLALAFLSGRLQRPTSIGFSDLPTGVWDISTDDDTAGLDDDADDTPAASNTLSPGALAMARVAFAQLRLRLLRDTTTVVSFDPTRTDERPADDDDPAISEWDTYRKCFVNPRFNTTAAPSLLFSSFQAALDECGDNALIFVGTSSTDWIQEREPVEIRSNNIAVIGMQLDRVFPVLGMQIRPSTHPSASTSNRPIVHGQGHRVTGSRVVIHNIAFRASPGSTADLLTVGEGGRYGGASSGRIIISHCLFHGSAMMGGGAAVSASVHNQFFLIDTTMQQFPGTPTRAVVSVTGSPYYVKVSRCSWTRVNAGPALSIDGVVGDAVLRDNSFHLCGPDLDAAASETNMPASQELIDAYWLDIDTDLYHARIAYDIVHVGSAPWASSRLVLLGNHVDFNQTSPEIHDEPPPAVVDSDSDSIGDGVDPGSATRHSTAFAVCDFLQLVAKENEALGLDIGLRMFKVGSVIDVSAVEDEAYVSEDEAYVSDIADDRTFLRHVARHNMLSGTVHDIVDSDMHDSHTKLPAAAICDAGCPGPAFLPLKMVGRSEERLEVTIALPLQPWHAADSAAGGDDDDSGDDDGDGNGNDIGGIESEEALFGDDVRSRDAAKQFYISLARGHWNKPVTACDPGLIDWAELRDDAANPAAARSWNDWRPVGATVAQRRLPLQDQVVRLRRVFTWDQLEQCIDASCPFHAASGPAAATAASKNTDDAATDLLQGPSLRFHLHASELSGPLQHAPSPDGDGDGAAAGDDAIQYVRVLRSVRFSTEIPKSWCGFTPDAPPFTFAPGTPPPPVPAVRFPVDLDADWGSTSLGRVLELRVRSLRRVQAGDASKEAAPWTLQHQLLQVSPATTALVIVDAWDTHWCATAAARLDALVRSAIAPAVNMAHAAGVRVVHSPTGTASFYDKTSSPYRFTAQSGLQRVAVASNARPDIPAHFGQPFRSASCPASPSDRPGTTPWTRQHAMITMAPGDIIATHIDELAAYVAKHGIKTLVFAGVHTNMCVVSNSVGIVSALHSLPDVTAVLADALTESMYDPNDYPFLSIPDASRVVQWDINRLFAPSVVSAAPVFRLALPAVPLSAPPIDATSLVSRNDARAAAFHTGVWLADRASDDAYTRNIAWQRGAGNLVYTAAVLVPPANKLAIIASQDHRVYALDTETGAVAWTTKLAGNANSDAVVSADGSRVFLACWDTHVYALDTQDGRVVWTSDKLSLVARNGAGSGAGARSDDVLLTAPVLSRDQRLVIVPIDRHIAALSVEDGKSVWLAQTWVDEKPGRDPILAPGVLDIRDEFRYVYFVTQSGVVLCISVRDGAVRWRGDYGLVDAVRVPVLLVPSATAPYVFLADTGGTVHKVESPGSGIQRSGRLWSSEWYRRAFRAPLAVDPVGNRILLASTDGTVTAVALRAPHELHWVRNIGTAVYSAPLVVPSAGVVFVAGFDGRIVALALDTGRPAWHAQVTPGVYGAMTLLPDDDSARVSLLVTSVIGNVCRVDINVDQEVSVVP